MLRWRHDLDFLQRAGSAVTSYNGFMIEVFEGLDGGWRIRVRRENGRSIVTPSGQYEAITSDIESASVGDAVAVAKSMIDAIVTQSEASTPTRH